MDSHVKTYGLSRNKMGKSSRFSLNKKNTGYDFSHNANGKLQILK